MKIPFNIPYLPKEPIFLFRKHGNPENIAVKSNMRGLSIGTGLVNSALEWF